MHLLLGDRSDPCCAGVLSRMEARGLSAQIIHAAFAEPAHLAWQLDETGLSSRYTWSDTRAKESAIESVFVRDPGRLDPTGWQPDDYAYAQAELQATLIAWLSGLECPVVNRYSAEQWYRPHRPLLAWRQLLRRSGLPVADAIITNSSVAARAFAARVATHGVVLTPLTGAASYLVSSESDWLGLSDLMQRAPVCLTEPHGRARSACVVGDRVVWDEPVSSETAQLAPGLLRLGRETGLDFLHVAVAQLPRGPAVVRVDAWPRLEQFSNAARDRVLDALVDSLTHTAAASRAAAGISQ